MHVLCVCVCFIHELSERSGVVQPLSQIIRISGLVRNRAQVAMSTAAASELPATFNICHQIHLRPSADHRGMVFSGLGFMATCPRETQQLSLTPRGLCPEQRSVDYARSWMSHFLSTFCLQRAGLGAHGGVRDLKQCPVCGSESPGHFTHPLPSHGLTQGHTAGYSSGHSQDACTECSGNRLA